MHVPKDKFLRKHFNLKNSPCKALWLTHYSDVLFPLFLKYLQFLECTTHEGVDSVYELLHPPTPGENLSERKKEEATHLPNSSFPVVLDPSTGHFIWEHHLQQPAILTPSEKFFENHILQKNELTYR